MQDFIEIRRINICVYIVYSFLGVENRREKQRREKEKLMKRKTLKMPKISALDARKRLLLAGGCAVLALLIALCITIIMRTNIQKEYTSARNEIGSELYSQVYMLCQTFDQVDVPGQDLQEGVLPAMRRYYTSAVSLNTAIASAFGSRYELLSVDDVSAFDRAFDAYDAAFRSGRSTDSSRSAMAESVGAARQLLSSRYADDRLKPAA